MHITQEPAFASRGRPPDRREPTPAYGYPHQDVCCPLCRVPPAGARSVGAIHELPLHRQARAARSLVKSFPRDMVLRIEGTV